MSRILFIFLVVCSTVVSAQLKDTIVYSMQQKPKFFFNITTFASIVNDEVVQFSGFKAGLNYNRRVKLGAGFYDLNNKVISTIHVDGDSGYTTSAELKLDFFSLSAEYVFYNNYPWQFSFVPFQLSLGEGHYEYIAEPQKVRTSTKGQFIVLYEPNLTGQYSIFRWIGIGANLGYRFTLYASKELKEDLSAPTFSLGLRLFVDELFKMAFPKKNKAEEKK